MSDTNTEWFRCRIDKQRLKELSQRNDRTPLLWFGSYILLVIASASAVVLSWNTPSVWVWLAVYGALWGLAPSAVHETCHHTPFRRRWLNKATLWLFGWMVQMEPQSVRWGHTGHHSHTHFEHGDTELSEPNPVSWSNFCNVGLGFWGALFYWKSLIWQGFGSITPEMRAVIPDGAIAKAIRNARYMLAVYLAVIAGGLLLQSWIPIVLAFAPRLIGGPVTGFLHLTQHTGLQMNIRDHRYSTRSFSASALTRYCYFNMNYHIEHHMFPLVPFYNLPRLAEELRPQMPEPNRGLLGVYREILTTVARQQREPGYYHRKQVPETTGQMVTARAQAA
jgi:fatty acid desaturase